MASYQKKKSYQKIQKFKDLGNDIQWSALFCKRCSLCVDLCPKKNLELVNNLMVEKNICIRCGLCEMHCPDFAIMLKKKS